VVLERGDRLYQTGCMVTEGEGRTSEVTSTPARQNKPRQANAPRFVPTPAGCPFFPMNTANTSGDSNLPSTMRVRGYISGTLRTSTAGMDFAVAALKDPPVRTGVTQVTVPLNQGAV